MLILNNIDIHVYTNSPMNNSTTNLNIYGWGVESGGSGVLKCLPPGAVFLEVPSSTKYKKKETLSPKLTPQIII